LRKKLQELEARLEALTQRCADIEAQLTGDVYGNANKDRLKELLLDQARARTELHEVEELWLETSEALQHAGSFDAE
jgi:ATP-binding cassette subfamily F protein 3